MLSKISALHGSTAIKSMAKDLFHLSDTWITRSFACEGQNNIPPLICGGTLTKCSDELLFFATDIIAGMQRCLTL